MEQHEIDELRKVFGKQLLLRQLRPRGTGSIIFGAIAILLGVTGISANPMNIVLALLGVFVMAEGIWLLSAPSPKGFIVDGCAIMGVGIWNILTTIQDMSLHPGAAPHFAVLGVLQLFWGVQSFGTSRRASEMLSLTPSPEAVNQADALVNTVTKSNFKSNPNYIEFRQQNFFVSQFWKGILIGNVVVLAGVQTHDGILARNDDFTLTPTGKYRPGKQMKATLTAGGKKMPILIPARSLERLQAWKSDVVLTR